MAQIKIALATRNRMAQANVTDLDAGSGLSTLEFYTGTMPSGPDAAVTDQVKLGTLVCSDPSATVAEGSITFAAITQDNAADAAGLATWARHKSSDGVAVNDYDVTGTEGDGAIKLINPVIVAGGSIAMHSLSITMGGA